MLKYNHSYCFLEVKMFKRKKIKYVNPNQERISTQYRKNEKQKKPKKGKFLRFIKGTIELILDAHS